MAKSTIKLENGTIVTIEGTVEEISKLLILYQNSTIGDNGSKEQQEDEDSTDMKNTSKDESLNTVKLVNATKGSDDLEQIEKNILDKASQVDRVLLPLFVADKEFRSEVSLTSNDIYKFLKEFGISMALPNVSKTLSTSALRYVIADSTRRKGASTGYKISRKGKQHLEQVLAQ